MYKISIGENIAQDLANKCSEVENLKIRGILPLYPKFVDCLFKEMSNPAECLHHATTGLSGEAGELLDASKKQWVYNKPLDVVNLIEELGDIRFYYQSVLNMLDLKDVDIKNMNTHKLMKRYPSLSYSDKQAQERLDKVQEDETKEPQD